MLFYKYASRSLAPSPPALLVSRNQLNEVAKIISFLKWSKPSEIVQYCIESCCIERQNRLLGLGITGAYFKVNPSHA